MVKRSVALSKKASFYKATQSRIARIERAINRHVASVARLESLFQNPSKTFDAKRCANLVKSLDSQCEYFNNQLAESMKSFRAAIALNTPTENIVKNIRSLSNLVTRIALLQAVAESSVISEDIIKLDDAGFIVEDDENKVEAKCEDKTECEAGCEDKKEEKQASVSVVAEGEEEKKEESEEAPKEESEEAPSETPAENTEAPADEEAIDDFSDELPDVDFPMEEGLVEEDVEDILNEKLPEDKNDDGINDATEEVLDEIQQQVYDQGDRIQTIEENLGIDTPLVEETEENSEEEMINVSSSKKSAKIQQKRLASCKATASDTSVDILSAIVAQDIR